MVVQLEVSHCDISPLNVKAFSNIPSIVVTRLVDQVDILPLNHEAPANMRVMAVADEVSQPSKSSTNVTSFGFRCVSNT